MASIAPAAMVSVAHDMTSISHLLSKRSRADSYPDSSVKAEVHLFSSKSVTPAFLSPAINPSSLAAPAALSSRVTPM